MAAGTGAALQAASTIHRQIDEKLAAIEEQVKRISNIVEGKRYFEIYGSVKVAGGVGEDKSHPTPQGFIFVPRFVAAVAPKGSTTKIYANTPVPPNLLKILEKAEVTEPLYRAWELVAQTRLFFVVTGAEAEGTATYRISGDLIPRKETATGHLP